MVGWVDFDPVWLAGAAAVAGGRGDGLGPVAGAAAAVLDGEGAGGGDGAVLVDELHDALGAYGDGPRLLAVLGRDPDGRGAAGRRGSRSGRSCRCAALDGRPITDVYTWLTRPTDDTAVDILREHGFTLTADQVAGVVDAPEKQRGGVFGTAQQMASCLTNRQVAA